MDPRIHTPQLQNSPSPRALPMSINWNNLRSWNGSQESGFEELCCQLASLESVPAGAEFFRKGTPDAGVECFWRLPSIDEWAWQAKYFRSAPNPNQWRQIDDSVKTALNNIRGSRSTQCAYRLIGLMPATRIRKHFWRSGAIMLSNGNVLLRKGECL